jgi:hypothetical protein
MDKNVWHEAVGWVLFVVAKKKKKKKNFWGVCVTEPFVPIK